MKRKDLLRYRQPLNRRSATPRHAEVNDNLVKKICKDLGIPPVR